MPLPAPPDPPVRPEPPAACLPWTTVVADALAAGTVAVVADVLPADAIGGLRRQALAVEAAGAMRAAGIGRRAGQRVDAAVRGDRIAWLDRVVDGPAVATYRDAMEALRSALNRDLMLGLADLEAHWAIYPAGAAYARHRDRFRDDDARQLAVILYLNDTWGADDGGALRVYLDDDATLEVTPHGGTLVVFGAERFEHEVLAARRPRIALTGWFRRRAAGSWPG